MGKIQDNPCPGCTVCPHIVWSGPLSTAKERTESSKPIDSINFTTKVNCLKGELTAAAASGRLSALDPRDQSIPRMTWNPLDFLGQAFPQEYPPQDQKLRVSYLEAQRREEAERERRKKADLGRIDAEAWAICQKVPGLEPIWLQFMRRTGDERTPLVARHALQLMQQLLGMFSPEAVKAEVVRTRKELVDLCMRVVKAWDAADDKMDMQDAIEELDSLLYDLDKREGLSGT